MKSAKHRLVASLLSGCILTGCAAYSVTATLPDGTQITGRAIVANESDSVALTVASEKFSATFNKSATDGSVAAETIEAVGALAPLLP